MRSARAADRRSVRAGVRAEVSVLVTGDRSMAAASDRAAPAASLAVGSGLGFEHASGVLARDDDYCGLLVVVDRVVVPPLEGSVSVFEWVSELPRAPSR
jgi:hypothetical protein